MAETNSIGFSSMAVFIESIQDGSALCFTEFQRPIRLNVNIRRGGGPLPREGERWLIDRTLGNWTFASLLNPNPPVITGAHSDGTAFKNLLEALVEMGLVIDDTVLEPIPGNYTENYEETY